MELSHLDGHKGSKPVRRASSNIYQNNTDLVYDRIGNGAADHIQLVSLRSLATLRNFLTRLYPGHLWRTVGVHRDYISFA